MADVFTPFRTALPRETAPPASAPWDAAFMLRLRRELAGVRAAETPSAAHAHLAAVLGALQLWDVLAIAAQAPLSDGLTLEGLLAPADGLSPSLRSQLHATAQQAIRDRRTVMHRVRDPDGWIIAAPCGGAELPAQALLALSTSVDAVKPSQSFVLELAASELAFGDVRRRLYAGESDLLRTAAVVELLDRLLETRSQAEVDRRLAAELARTLGTVRVSVGRRSSGTAPLRLSAEAGAVDSFGEVASDIRLAVLEETLLRGRMGQWPAESAADETGLLLHRQFVERHSERWLVTLPLAGREGSAAALMIQGAAAQAVEQQSAARLLSAAGTAITGAYSAARLAERGLWERLRETVGGAIRRRRVWVWSAAAIVLANCLALPVPHRIECDCTLEPVLRQFVAAPFAAALEEVLVRPGDDVVRDQVLARLDGREVRWELAGVTADLQRASRERDGHLAQHDSGAARLSELECERLQLQTRLLEHRMAHLEIRSPIDGLVLTGDLDQAIGAPLEIGQTLFELAPLDALTVEVEVPERDITYATQGQPVEFWLESRPTEPYRGTLERIHPRAEPRDGGSVFIAEVSLPNVEGWLRPGLSGTARLDAGTCRLAWRLLHRPWEQLRLWWGY